MPPKKRNGLSMYIDKVMRPIHKERTGNNLPIHEFINDALPLYQALSIAEKNYYEQLAKEYNKGIKGKRMNLNYTPSRIMQYDERDQLFNESQSSSITKARQIIVEKFSRLPLSDIKKMKFYLIGGESMCLINEDYMPLIELGIIQFNLNEGITKEFHKFIYPGPIPIGYRSAANENSQSRHMISVEKFELGERSYSQLYKLVVDFFGNSDYLAFCLDEDTKHVFRGLDWLYEKARLLDAPALTLGRVEDLLELLLKKVGANFSQMEVQDMLSISYYDHGDHSRCSLHDEVNAKYCALGSTKRNCYMMIENLAKFYDIKLTSRHIPVDSISIQTTPPSENFNPPINTHFKESSIFGSTDIRFKETKLASDSNKYMVIPPSSIRSKNYQKYSPTKAGSVDLGFSCNDAVGLRSIGRGACIIDSESDKLYDRSVITQVSSTSDKYMLDKYLNSSDGSKYHSGAGSVKSCGSLSMPVGSQITNPFATKTKLLPPSNFEPIVTKSNEGYHLPAYSDKLFNPIHSLLPQNQNIEDAFERMSTASSIYSGVTNYSEMQQNHIDVTHLSDISDVEDV